MKKTDPPTIPSEGAVLQGPSSRQPNTINVPQFRRAQVQLIHKQMRSELLLNLSVLAAVVSVFWNRVPLVYVAGWSLLVTITLAWRSLFISDRSHAPDSVDVWYRGYGFAALISGAVWGALGAAAYLYGSRETQVIALVSLLSVTLAAYTSMQSSPRIFAAFALPALSPGIVGIGITGEAHLTLLSGSVGMLIMLMLVWARSFKAMLAESIKLSSHNTVLIRDLIGSRQAAENARHDLERANRELATQVYERREAENRIRESKERIQAIIESMQDTIFHVDKDGSITWTTPSIRQLLGYAPEEVVGFDVGKLFMSPQERSNHDQALESSFGGLQNHEFVLRHKSGNAVWVSENCIYRYNEVGGITGYESTLRDITALKQTKEALFLAQERAYVTLGSIGDGVIAVNMDGRIDYMNIVAEQGTGWELEEAHGKPMAEVFRIVDEKTLESTLDPVQLCLEEGKATMLPGYLLLIHRHIHQHMSIEVNAAPIRNSNGDISGVVLVFHDVSELRSLAQMTYHATHDSLTGLINRREFEKRINQALQYTRDRDKRYALCYLDLDNFKVVNDTCGHGAGDELLKQLTTLLRGALREGDTLSRIGGDEFGILFAGCSLNVGKRLAEKIRRHVEDFRFAWGDKSFRVGASMGLVPVTADSGTISDVLSAADSACYVAKENGRNRIHIYRNNDIAVAEQKGQMQWVQRIQEVLEHDRFRLYFQAIAPTRPVPGEENKLHGEVLIRMLESDGSLIGPDAFIPAAERYSLMGAIDRWVVKNTLQMLSRNIDEVQERISVCSINLSGQSLSDDRFMGALVEMIDEMAIPPELLCFEITETAVISNLSNATRLIDTLRDMGCRFALDDFGVGLSSFGYLKSLAVDYLKLDGCFIKNMTRDSIDYAMVHSINHVGQTLKIKTIAEFVENDETLQALREIGVDYAQGYGIAKPVPLEQAIYGSAAPELKLVVSS
ncbi:MAG: EAL domain-containing protein [Thiogranum sp.]|nr:EAL domain-containing protein [Thiogranum sp.]